MLLRCTNCGADVPIDQESDFLECDHCGAALFADAEKAITRFCMKPNVDEEDLRPLVGRHLAEIEIGAEALLERHEMVYCPFWRFETGAGHAALIAAADAGAEELNRLEAPSGALVAYDPAVVERFRVSEPALLADQATAEFLSEHPADPAPEYRLSMVYLPIYRIAYRLEGHRYFACIEAVSGAVVADHWPPTPQRERDRSLGAIAVSAFSAFLLEAIAIPSSWLLLAAYAVTAAATYWYAARALGRMGW